MHIHRLKKFFVILSATALLAVSACGLKVDSTENETSTSGPVTAETPGPKQTTNKEHSEQTRNGQQAVVTAAKHVGGTAFSVDRDDDGWEVDVLKDGRKVEVTLNASGTKVLKTDTDDKVSEARRKDLEKARVSLEDAIAIAATRVGGNLDEAEFDSGRAEALWSVTMDVDGVEIEVLLNITQARVLKAERD